MHQQNKTTLTDLELEDRIKGILFGAAIGDGVGLATEFMAKKEAQTLYGNGPIKFGKEDGYEFWRNAFRSRWFENDFTDDTDQQLLIAQCLLTDHGILNPHHLAYRIREWTKLGLPELRNKMPNGIGLTVGSVCSHPDLETDPLRAAYDVWNARDRNLAANGAIMRTGVLGIPFFWDESKVLENAMMGAKVTHADPRSVTSAVIVSVIISRLLRGEISDNQEKIDQIYCTKLLEMGSTEKGEYLQNFSDYPAPVPKSRANLGVGKEIVRKLQRFSSYIAGNEMNPLLEFEIPKHLPADPQRLERPALIRKGVRSMDEFGEDPEMGKLCRDVVDQYKFLLENNSLCPEKPREKEASWVDQLYSHCFPENLAALELEDRPKIGYTYKCLGAAVYCASRKIPENLTPQEFFQHVITELTLEAGDADTNCAAAGAVLGARLGMKGLPKGWVEGLRHYQYLEKISTDLCQMVRKTFTNI